MIRERGNCKRPFEEGRSGLTDELTFLAIPRNQLTDEPIVLEGIIEGNQVRRILVDGRSSSEIVYEHCFRDLDVNIRSKLRRCRAPMVGFSGETYHPLGVIDLRVIMGRERRSKTVLIECAIIKFRSSYNIIVGRTRLKSLKVVGSTIHSMIKFPTNQGIVTMETSKEALWECIWECIQLKRVQGLWKEEGIIRKVRHPEWIANTIPVKLANGTWRVQVDYSSLNKVCAKDMYPFPKEGKELASLMGYPYKCFLRLPKEYNQIKMADDDEEKTRMMENVLADQRGRNVEIYLEEVVIKSKSEQHLIQDVEETLRKLKRVNIKINLITSSFGVKEGRKFIPKLAKLKYPIREARMSFPEEKDSWKDGLLKYGHISYIPRKEAEGLVVKKFLVKESRLYLGKETIEEGSGVGIILVSPEEKMYSYDIRLKFNASNHAMDCEALLAGLAASTNQGMKDLHVFIDLLTLVAQVEGNHTPATEHERKYKEEIMDATAPFHMFRITHLSKILNLKAEMLTRLATINLEFLNQEVSVGIKTRPSVEEASSNKKGKAISNVP
ncbi:reverse transcriptase domain-containing protein [Tanacetum coccineum]